MDDPKTEVERLLMLDLEIGTRLQNIEKPQWTTADCKFNSYLYDRRMVTVVYSCFLDEIKFETFWKRYAPR